MALDPTVNGIVVFALALPLGAILYVIRLLSPEPDRSGTERRPGESVPDYVRRRVDRSAAEGREIAAVMPRSIMFMNLAFFGFIAVVVLVFALSPLEMRWLLFVSGFFLGFLSMRLIAWLARTGRIRAGPGSVLDRVLLERPNGR